MNQQKVWDKIAPFWNKYKVERGIKNTSLIDEFIEEKDNNILDLGCGSGRNFIKIKGFKGTIYGVDFSEQMLKFAKKNSEKIGINVKLTKANVWDIPFKDNFFDKVIFMATLHCIKGKQKRIKTLKEIYRVLKQKGRMLITIWNKKSKRWKNKGKEITARWTVENVDEDVNTNSLDAEKVERYYYLYDYDELKQELENIGFKIIKHNFVESARNIILIAEK